jgi:hypothetical protein
VDWGEVLWKVGRKVNQCNKMCTHVCKCKNGTCCELLQKLGEGNEGEWLRR